MLARLGLVGRLVLILMVVLIPLGLLGVLADWGGRATATGTGLRLPLPDQVAAIVQALETNKGADREVLLRAVNSDLLRVSIAKSPPALPEEARHMPAAEWLVRRYMGPLTGRHVEVVHIPSPRAGVWRRFVQWSSPLSQAPLRITAAMSTGEYAVIETHGAPTQRLVGLPTGFWIGALGALLGALAIAAIVREARPLTELAKSVTRFSRDGKPEPIAPTGAADVRALIEAVNAMQARIAALIKGRTILLGAVSHDLKTYITRLRLRVEALSDEAARDKAVRDLEDMTALIDTSIAVARGGGEAVEHVSVDMAALVSTEAAVRAGAALAVSLPAAPCRVLGDAVGLRRVLANLIDNALRYGRRCEVSLSSMRDVVTLIVDDDGPGIPPAEREAVLEPFVRMEPSRNRATGGSGLGLAIVRQIVEAHRGTIAIGDSRLGGASLRVQLPTAPAPRLAN